MCNKPRANLYIYIYIYSTAVQRMAFVCIRLKITCCQHRRPVVAPPSPAEPEPEDDSLDHRSSEGEWDVVSEAQSDINEKVAFRAPSIQELENPGLRFYCVWSFAKGAVSWPGVHWGLGNTAYQGLIRLNNGSFGGLRWKRTRTYEAARELFNQEKAKHGLGHTTATSDYHWK